MQIFWHAARKNQASQDHLARRKSGPRARKEILRGIRSPIGNHVLAPFSVVVTSQTSLIQVHTNEVDTPDKLAIVLYADVEAR